jgi:hypothetical protein
MAFKVEERSENSKCQNCYRVLPSYDDHIFCIACMDPEHDTVACAICASFPEELLEVRKQGVLYLIEHSDQVDSPGWPDEFFATFPRLDVPPPHGDTGSQDEDEDTLVVDEGILVDTDGRVTLIPDAGEQKALLQDAKFQNYLRKLRESRSSESLSLDNLLGSHPARISPIPSPTSVGSRPGTSGVPPPSHSRKRKGSSKTDVDSKTSKSNDVLITAIVPPEPSMAARWTTWKRC